MAIQALANLELDRLVIRKVFEFLNFCKND